MTNLNPLNSQRFFCECQAGERGSCRNFHVERVEQRSFNELWTSARLLFLMVAVAVIVLVVDWLAHG